MMEGWWPVYGGPSLAAGAALGFIWAMVSTARRRRRFAKAGLDSRQQWGWFLANFLSMGAYVALLTVVSLLALGDLIANEATWFILGSAGLAFCTALVFPRFDLPQPVTEMPPLQQSSPRSLRKSA